MNNFLANSFFHHHHRVKRAKVSIMGFVVLGFFAYVCHSFFVVPPRVAADLCLVVDKPAFGTTDRQGRALSVRAHKAWHQGHHVWSFQQVHARLDWSDPSYQSHSRQISELSRPSKDFAYYLQTPLRTMSQNPKVFIPISSQQHSAWIRSRCIPQWQPTNPGTFGGGHTHCMRGDTSVKTPHKASLTQGKLFDFSGTTEPSEKELLPKRLHLRAPLVPKDHWCQLRSQNGTYYTKHRQLHLWGQVRVHSSAYGQWQTHALWADSRHKTIWSPHALTGITPYGKILAAKGFHASAHRLQLRGASQIIFVPSRS